MDIIKEINRCLNCKNPSCINGCPLNTKINKLITLLKNGYEEEAIKLQYEYNSIPFICGKLCDHFRGCMGSCNLKKDPIKIGKICQFIGNKRLEQNIRKKEPNNIKVAIIGGGVAGLIVAERLLEEGYTISIFEKTCELGGILNNTLPDFRFDKNILKKWIKRIFDLGLIVHYNQSLGENLSFNDLKEYNKIVIAVGAIKSRRIFSDELSFDALKILRDYHYDKCFITNKKVVILGGGNTAYDVARVMKKLNNDVSIAYRRDITNSPASKEEINIALKEGIKVLEYLSPKKIIIQNQDEKTIIFSKTKLFDDGSKRLSFIETDEEVYLDTNIVIEAIGSLTDLSFLKQFSESLLDEKGYAKNIVNDNLYIIGDAYLGPSSFVKVNQTARICVEEIIKSDLPRVLFGGSFNPPTIAHYEIIKYLALSKRFKEILILPNGDSYNFAGKSLHDFEHRFEMLTLMVKEFANVSILRDENKPEFKGTALTLAKLNHPYFVLGDDCLDKLHLWKNFEQLITENKFILFNRGNDKDLKEKILNNVHLKDYLDHFEIIDLKIPNVSSTFFKLLKDEKMVTSDVLEYIKKHKLYEF